MEEGGSLVAIFTRVFGIVHDDHETYYDWPHDIDNNGRGDAWRRVREQREFLRLEDVDRLITHARITHGSGFTPFHCSGRHRLIRRYIEPVLTLGECPPLEIAQQ